MSKSGLDFINQIYGYSVNEAVINAFKTIKTKGVKSESRNGDATFINDAEFLIENPRLRHLSLRGRSSNIFQLIAETLWVVSGEDRINPYLEFFLPRAPQYSDDGLTWRGAYGKRIYNHNQLQSAIDMFSEDGEMTRRAYVAIHDPNIDAPDRVKLKHPEGTRDTPCNLGILFYVGTDGKFHARTIQRSGDVIFGAGSINLFEFTFIQELVLYYINKKRKAQGLELIELGHYRHSTVNLHAYESTESQIDNVLSQTQRVYSKADNNSPIIGCGNLETTRAMLYKFVNQLAPAWIVGKQDHYCGMVRQVESLMKEFGCPVGDETQGFNILKEYMLLTGAYILSKRKINPVELVHTVGTYIYDVMANQDLLSAVSYCRFRKFQLAGIDGDLPQKSELSPEQLNVLNQIKMELDNEEAK